MLVWEDMFIISGMAPFGDIKLKTQMGPTELSSVIQMWRMKYEKCVYVYTRVTVIMNLYSAASMEALQSSVV